MREERGVRATPPGHATQPALCLAYLCLHHGGALGAQRVADRNGVRQHSPLVALAVPAPGTQGHIWRREEENEDTVLQSSAHRL